jgi:hypothetical protein
MAFDILGVLASFLIVAAEGFSPIHLRVSIFLFFSAIALLLAAFRQSYLISALILLMCAGCASILCRMPSSPYGSSSSSSSSKVKLLKDKVAPLVIGSFIHIIGVWCLPILAIWGWCDAYSNKTGTYFQQEIGHLAPSTFYFVFLTILPLFIMPRGYEKGDIDHQFLESTIICVSAIVYFVIFRIAHFFQGQSPPGYMAAGNWDHELIGLVWLGSCAAAAIMAKIGYKTSIQVAFPAAFVCFSMLSHNHHSTDVYDDAPENQPWEMTWMKLHFMHALAFGMVALCRLLYRIPEAVFFSFLGACIFVSSSKNVVHPLHDALDWNIPPGVDISDCPDCVRGYPTSNVVGAIVVSISTIWFPVHLVTLEQLRKCVEQWTPATFAALPTEDPTDRESANHVGGSENDMTMKDAEGMNLLIT